MNADSHRRVANFLDAFHEVVKGVVGYASDSPFCYSTTPFSEDERSAIVASLQQSLSHERDQVEFREHTGDAELLQGLIELAIRGICPKNSIPDTHIVTCNKRGCQAKYTGREDQPPADWTRIVVSKTFCKEPPRLACRCPEHPLPPGGIIGDWNDV